MTIAAENPVGPVVNGAVKAAGEVSEKQTLGDGRERITKLIASKMKEAFRRKGQIE